MEKKKSFQKILIVLLFLFIPISCFSDSIAEAKEKRDTMVNYAKGFVGVPYVWGGLDKTGIDCSGLIFTVARESIGLQLPRTVAALYGYVKIIPNNQKEPGDILFFKTVGDRVSHAGIYIGNNQFIHAASDGPNTGVILSSLNEVYWKEHYFAVGQILPPTLTVAQAPSSGENENSSSGDFIENLKLDISAFYDWNFLNANQFLLNSRGFSLQGNIAYTKNDLWPGLMVGLKYDSKIGVLQIPLAFSLSIAKGFRFYAGPVITLGSPKLPGTDGKIKASFFPGILGVSWQSRDLKIGECGLSFVQDIAYQVYNKENDAALPILDSIVAGLIFSTGLRVTFPSV